MLNKCLFNKLMNKLRMNDRIGKIDPQAGTAEISRMYLPNAADQSKYTDSITEDFF